MKLANETKGMLKGILTVAAAALVVGIVIISILEARRPEEVITTVTAIDEEQTEVLAQVWNPVLSGANVGEERILLQLDATMQGGYTFRVIIPNMSLRLMDDAPDDPAPPILIANELSRIPGLWEGEVAHNDFAGERYRSGRVVYTFETFANEPIHEFELHIDLEYAEFWAMDLVVIERVHFTEQTRITAPFRIEMTIGRPLLPQSVPAQVQYAIGLLLGAAVSLAKVILLERSINKAMGKGTKNAAAGSMRVGYASRYLMTAAVLLGGLFLMDFHGFVGAFVGALTFTVSAYTARIFMKKEANNKAKLVEKGGML